MQNSTICLGGFQRESTGFVWDVPPFNSELKNGEFDNGGHISPITIAPRWTVLGPMSSYIHGRSGRSGRLKETYIKWNPRSWLLYASDVETLSLDVTVLDTDYCVDDSRVEFLYLKGHKHMALCAWVNPTGYHPWAIDSGFVMNTTSSRVWGSLCEDCPYSSLSLSLTMKFRENTGIYLPPILPRFGPVKEFHYPGVPLKPLRIVTNFPQISPAKTKQRKVRFHTYPPTREKRSKRWVNIQETNGRVIRLMKVGTRETPTTPISQWNE